MESSTFQVIINHITEINVKLNEIGKQHPLTDKWLDNQEVCELLKSSPRTLQYYRDNDIIPFSQFKSKIYYKAKDIEDFLLSNYSNSAKKK